MEKGHEILKETGEKMAASVRRFAEELSHLRAGRASVALVDHVIVEAYEDRMPLRNIANITTPDATTILILPYDKSVLKSIEKALSSQEMGLNPVSDGNVVRINIPPLTEERRKEVLKVANKVAEDGRVALRNLRREAIEALRKLQRGKELGEDEYHYFAEEIDKVLEKRVEELEEMRAKKEREILEG